MVPTEPQQQLQHVIPHSALAGDGRVRYRHFKFGECRPAAHATTVEHPDQIVAGNIKVTCHAVEYAGDKSKETKNKQHLSAGPLGIAAASKKLPEGIVCHSQQLTVPMAAALNAVLAEVACCMGSCPQHGWAVTSTVIS